VTPIECARAVAGPAGRLGGRFMLDRQTFVRGGELGFSPGFAYYAGGRLGVLGRVHPDVALSAAVFIAPSVLVPAWEEALGTAEPADIAAHYAGVCADYGRDHLADGDHLDRFVALAERVVDSASPLGAPIFAGWRALPRPGDRQGRANQLLHLLRELRFARHAVAVLAAGIDPVAAVVGTGGEGNAALFGWQPPHPDPAASADARAAAEAATDDRSAADLAVLDETEAAELAVLLTRIEETIA
jgi:hypothetical protein